MDGNSESLVREHVTNVNVLELTQKYLSIQPENNLKVPRENMRNCVQYLLQLANLTNVKHFEVEKRDGKSNFRKYRRFHFHDS